MMDKLIKPFAKRYIVGKLNDILKSTQDNEKVQYYRQRITSIMHFLSNLMVYIEDNNLDSEEVEKIVKEVKELI